MDNQNQQFIFNKKGGRPRVLTDEQRREAILESKRKWANKTKARKNVYNQSYYKQNREKINEIL